MIHPNTEDFHCYSKGKIQEENDPDKLWQHTSTFYMHEPDLQL